MENIHNVFIQVIEKPERRVMIKRGVKATDYFEYCEELGCEVWGLLMSMEAICGEPVSMWLPKELIKPGSSQYVQGVELPQDYEGEIPEGFDIITMPAGKFLMFQGEPFEEENYLQAIKAVQSSMEKYDPSIIGLERDPGGPRIQLEPRGARGYIEMLAVKERVK